MTQTDEEGRSPLLLAIYRGNLSLVKLLLQTYKVDSKHKDSNGKNCLHYLMDMLSTIDTKDVVAKKNIQSLTNVLFNHGALDIQARDKSGRSIMQCWICINDTNEI